MNYLIEISLPEGVEICSLYPHHHKGAYLCVVDRRGPYFVYGSGYGATIEEATTAAIARLDQEYSKVEDRKKATEAYYSKHPKKPQIELTVTLEDLGL